MKKRKQMRRPWHPFNFWDAVAMDSRLLGEQMISSTLMREMREILGGTGFDAPEVGTIEGVRIIEGKRPTMVTFDEYAPITREQWEAAPSRSPFAISVDRGYAEGFK